MKTENLIILMRKLRFTSSAISRETGISRQSLWKKLSGKVEFTASEIAKLVSLLGIKPEEIQKLFLEEELTNDNKGSRSDIEND